jgi:hypothetical protein
LSGCAGSQFVARSPGRAAAFSWQAGIYRVTFSIAHGGLWSPRQAFRVAEAVRAEALAVGLMLVPVWVRHSMPTRVVLLVLCRRHAIEVAPGTMCAKCRAEWPQ